MVRYSLVFAFLLFIFISCRDERSKKEFVLTTKICDSFYIEKYNIFRQGAFGGDIRSHYLTDSVNFRVYIGSYDNGYQHYYYKCTDDSIYVYFLERINNEIGNVKRKLHKAYNIKELKKSKKFE